MSLLLAGSVVAYVSLDRSINTFSASGISRHRPPPSVHGQNILLIGSDSRAGADRGLGGAGPAVGRSDTTLLVHVYEGGRRAVAVSIPRDALVDIPACRLPDGNWSQPQRQAMFNAAFSVGQTASGNPACTVNTVEKLTGMRVDHTVVADFVGFAAMTKIVGGVPVCVPNPVYQGDLDPNLGQQGKLVFHKGLQTVSGTKALDYVRLRHGIGDGSDIGRMRRQQAFLGSVVAKVRAEGVTPTRIVPLASAATKYLTVDAELGTADKLVSFLVSLRHMSPEDIVFVTTPWRYDGPRVALVHPDVDRLWAALRNDEPVSSGDRSTKTRPLTVAQTLASVTKPVTVLNGTSVTGLGARTAVVLRKAGIRVSVVANGPGERRTLVEYGPGLEGQAHALAAAFVGARTRVDSQPGLRLRLGAQHRIRSLRSVATSRPLPASITVGARSAATHPCTDVSYGAAP
ncbi:MAG TPA: LCP family protein [Nocardioidaceae bacterium]|nr:LCP family protein [Nocardioidaceae bacterium]